MEKLFSPHNIYFTVLFITCEDEWFYIKDDVTKDFSSMFSKFEFFWHVCFSFFLVLVIVLLKRIFLHEIFLAGPLLVMEIDRTALLQIICIVISPRKIELLK